MNFHIGIDPGKTGAISVMSKDLVFVWDMPESIYKIWSIRSEIMGLFWGGFAIGGYIEKVHAIRGASAHNTWVFAEQYGIAKAFLSSFENINIEYYAPKIWQKDICKESGNAKKQYTEYAMRKWPDMVTLKKHDGRAAALCICEFGMKNSIWHKILKEEK